MSETEKPKKPKKLTKAEKLAQAVDAARSALQAVQDKWSELENTIEAATDELQGAINTLEDKMADLRGVREDEYQSWYDNMPENMQGTPTYEKLQNLMDIDLEPEMPEIPEVQGPDCDAVESALDEIENAELPQGFGRD